MKSDIEIARQVLRELGGEATNRFETCVVDDAERPFGVRLIGRGACVPVETDEQARRVVALLTEILGQGTRDTHRARVVSCLQGNDHDFQVLYRCSCCGFLVSELP